MQVAHESTSWTLLLMLVTSQSSLLWCFVFAWTREPYTILCCPRYKQCLLYHNALSMACQISVGALASDRSTLAAGDMHRQVLKRLTARGAGGYARVQLRFARSPKMCIFHSLLLQPLFNHYDSNNCPCWAEHAHCANNGFTGIIIEITTSCSDAACVSPMYGLRSSQPDISPHTYKRNTCRVWPNTYECLGRAPAQWPKPVCYARFDIPLNVACIGLRRDIYH